MFPKFDKAPGDENAQGEKHYAKAVDAAQFVSGVAHSPEELEKACAVYQAHLERMQPYFKVFAGSLSVPFEFTSSVSTAAFDDRSGKVLLGVEWFVEKNLSPTQASWVVFHELSHFSDFAGDTKRYKENLEKDCVQAATRIGAYAEKSYSQIFEKAMPEAMKQTIEKEAQYGFLHSFYGALDDIWVNSNVSYKASMYSRDLPAGKEITKLYSDVLFPSADLLSAGAQGESPRHMQFGNALLRKEMVPEEELVVGDDVREALEKKMRFDKRTHSPREIINNYIKPGAGRMVSIGRRYDVLEATLLPVFEELYKKDIDELLARMKGEEEEEKKEEGEKNKGGDQKKEEGENKPEESKGGTGEQSEEKDGGDKKDGAPENTEKNEEKTGKGESKKGEGEEKQEGGEGEDKGGGPGEKEKSKKQVPRDGSFFKEHHNQAKEQTPDIVDAKDIEKWYEQAKENEEKKKGEEEARVKNEQEKAQIVRDKTWCEQNKIELPLYQEYKRIEALVAPHREELARLWRHIAFGESLGVDRSMVPGAKVGANVHIPSVIHSYPDIVAGDFENVRVMERVKHAEKKIDKPERIEISVVLDRSGSMNSRGSIKTDVATQAVVLLLSSLEDFNGYLASARGRTKSPLHADTEVIVYGDHARRIKSFRKNKGSVDEKREVVNVMGHVYENYGTTADNEALKLVNNTVTAGDEVLIKKGKLMKIVIEVTDGVSDDPEETQGEIGRLDKSGVIVRAFQIGGSANDQRKFTEIWNSGPTQHGFVVGGDVKNLVPALAAALREHLGSIEL